MYVWFCSGVIGRYVGNGVMDVVVGVFVLFLKYVLVGLVDVL